MKFPIVPSGSLLRVAVVLGAGLLVLNGCSSSSSSSPADLQAQAVDGYIVNASVNCDNQENGTTGLAGAFTCPPGTLLYTITGGIDVGFDEFEDENGVLFLGQLSAPSTLSYVTPTSTLIVELARDEDGEYDATQFEDALETLETALGMEIDPAADATTDLDTVKRNAQLQNVINSFVDSTDDYNTVISAFTNTLVTAVNSTQTIDLVSGVDELLTGVNNELINLDQNVAKDPNEISTLAANIAATNFEINRAEGTTGVTQAAKQPASSGQVMTINRNAVDVILGSSGNLSTRFGISAFESDSVNSEGHYLVTASSQIDSIGFDRAALSIDSTVTGQAIELGFELNATGAGDNRKLSVATNAELSMTEGDNASIQVRVPQGTIMNVTAFDSDGTRTDASFTVSNQTTFSSDSGFVSIDLEDIEERLADNDITGFLDRSGNYEVTMVVGGVRVAETVENVKVLLSPYTVVTDGMTVNGTGFRGYATFLSANQ